MSVQRPPSALAESLLKIAGSGDGERLRECLEGRHLPAEGGDLSPADIVYRACEEVADRLDWDGLAFLLAQVITEVCAAAETKPLDTKQVYLLRNALDLAAELAPNQDLWAALAEIPCASEDGLRSANLLLPFFRAMVFHQEDDRIEYVWFDLIDEIGESARDWTPEVRTVLLTAWRGLLWIPTKDDRSVTDFDRIDRGLAALSRSVEKRPDAEARRLLMSALGILQETYPRSVEFWEEHLGPLVDRWSPALREVAYGQWPRLGAPLRRRRAS
jgi:hypothetical protein